MRAAGLLVLRGDTVAGWDQMTEVEAAEQHLGNRYLTSLHQVHTAMGLCAQSRFAEALAPLTAAEHGIAELAQAAELPVEYLLRNSPAGNLILFARAWLALAGARPVDLDELTAIVDAGAAEGQLFVSIGVRQMVALARYFDGDQASAEPELHAVAEQADAVGVLTFISFSNIFIAIGRDEKGDAPGARALLTATEPVTVACGNLHNLARFHCYAGAFALTDGEVAEAERRAHACLTSAHANGYGWEAAMGLELLSLVAAATASPIEAVRLAAAAARVRDERAIWFALVSERDRLAAGMGSCREALGDEAFEAAWAAGYTLSLDDAMEYAQRARGERKRPALGWESLTPTERLVVEQVEAGLTNPQIGEKLLISRRHRQDAPDPRVHQARRQDPERAGGGRGPPPERPGHHLIPTGLRALSTALRC